MPLIPHKVCWLEMGGGGGGEQLPSQIIVFPKEGNFSAR